LPGKISNKIGADTRTLRRVDAAGSVKGRMRERILFD
jgi:hypothetical protein